jgi:hypothetical protein
MMMMMMAYWAWALWVVLLMVAQKTVALRYYLRDLRRQSTG